MTTLAVRPLQPEDRDYPAFVKALAAARLPTDDLGEDGRFFALHVGREEALAYGGLAGSGPDRMIRSVVVPEGARGRGQGRLMVRLLEEQALHDGAERLWLLTTSAAPFFAGLGWTVADRSEAPTSIRDSRQFRGLCPSSAVLMCKTLP